WVSLTFASTKTRDNIVSAPSLDILRQLLAALHALTGGKRYHFDLASRPASHVACTAGPHAILTRFLNLPLVLPGLCRHRLNQGFVLEQPMLLKIVRESRRDASPFRPLPFTFDDGSIELLLVCSQLGCIPWRGRCLLPRLLEGRHHSGQLLGEAKAHLHAIGGFLVWTLGSLFIGPVGLRCERRSLLTGLKSLKRGGTLAHGLL